MDLWIGIYLIVNLICIISNKLFIFIDSAIWQYNNYKINLGVPYDISLNLNE